MGILQRATYRPRRFIRDERGSWQCKAQRTADPPQDCDWPVCGCDPQAQRVIDALDESGAFAAAEQRARNAALESAARIARERGDERIASAILALKQAEPKASEGATNAD